MVSNIFYFHAYLGKIPILTHIFQMGLKPPTRTGPIFRNVAWLKHCKTSSPFGRRFNPQKLEVRKVIFCLPLVVLVMLVMECYMHLHCCIATCTCRWSAICACNDGLPPADEHGCHLVFGPLGWQLKGNTWSTIVYDHVLMGWVRDIIDRHTGHAFREAGYSPLMAVKSTRKIGEDSRDVVTKLVGSSW